MLHNLVDIVLVESMEETINDAGQILCILLEVVLSFILLVTSTVVHMHDPLLSCLIRPVHLDYRKVEHVPLMRAVSILRHNRPWTLFMRLQVEQQVSQMVLVAALGCNPVLIVIRVTVMKCMSGGI